MLKIHVMQQIQHQPRQAMDWKTAYMYKICVFFCPLKPKPCSGKGRKENRIWFLIGYNCNNDSRLQGIESFFLLTYNLPGPPRSDHPVVQTFHSFNSNSDIFPEA
jgi:hypothetical protein